ncbi:type II toxin-antitoxin system RelE/ParE family toxin [Flavobacterium ovatum]|uniref:type II toxin-antitoxin system RelE/ParE family toxin n=1 Tax=Flavobacterium ovatum TaxID=1928857 RepID=UPI00344E8C52
MDVYRAKRNIAATLEYIEGIWNKNIRVKFATKLNETIKLIAVNPDLFPVSAFNKKIRRCVLSKQSTLFYNFSNDKIIILALFNTRQDPNKINKIK